MPLPQPASDAAGIIRYTVFGTTPDLAYSHLEVSVDGRGRAEHVPEPILLPPALKFTPFQVLPSPDGRYMVLMEPVEPGGRPYVFDQVTGQGKVLFQPYGGGSFFGWHPDGHQFLFWIDSVGLWLIDAETLESTTLALPEGPVQGAAISPDGLRVAYIAENRPTLGSLWLVSTAGSDAAPQFDAGDISYLYPGAWSPDGTRIVYYGNCVQPLPKGEVPPGGPLCLFDMRTQERRALNLPFAGFSPTWSPDSRYIAATGLTPDESSCSGKNLSAFEQDDCQYVARSIYILDTLTGEVRLLTSGIAPVWSPDGSMLAFLSNRSGAPEVWTIHVDGTGLQQLTTDGQRKSPYQLTWSREVKK
jgi:Tol biopolymer transport system component